jgi:hypothetical protein
MPAAERISAVIGNLILSAIFLCLLIVAVSGAILESIAF